MKRKKKGCGNREIANERQQSQKGGHETALRQGIFSTIIFGGGGAGGLGGGVIYRPN